MSGARPLRFAAQTALPLGHLSFVLGRTECGALTWAIRIDPPEGMEARPQLLANGFAQESEDRAALAAQLDAIADAVEDWP